MQGRVGRFSDLAVGVASRYLIVWSDSCAPQVRRPRFSSIASSATSRRRPNLLQLPSDAFFLGESSQRSAPNQRVAAESLHTDCSPQPHENAVCRLGRGLTMRARREPALARAESAQRGKTVVNSASD
jgi:hypothetical protein